ncbi:MOB kinase activator 2-like isoform X2 [Lineus longissimus]|uniref:MOB kinase activator 2-like isoform X2 n=1 Tax=Lineus longissimus TaxID=88925 RepID=UPI002B4D1727
MDPWAMRQTLALFRYWTPVSKGRRKDKDSPTPAPEEYRLYLEDQYVRDSCVSDGDLIELIHQPKGLCHDEWLATHTISFFEHINLMYGTISEYCTATGCTAMTAPCNTQYYWLDEKGKKCKCAAPQYVDYVMTYIQKTIADESIFPTKYGQVFPSDFEAMVKKIHRLLFHVLAHLYHAHFKELVQLSLQGHLNILMKHFMIFNTKFNLIDEKDVDILDDLTRVLLSNHNTSTEDKENSKTNQDNSNETLKDGKDDKDSKELKSWW